MIILTKINISYTIIKTQTSVLIKDIIIMKKMINIKKKISLITNIIITNTEIEMIMKIEEVTESLDIQKMNLFLILIIVLQIMIY